MLAPFLRPTRKFLEKSKKSFFFVFLFLLPIWSGAFFFALGDSGGHARGFETTYIILNSIFAPLAIFAFLRVPSSLGFYFGFYVGIGLFYWVGFSFLYSPAPYLLPIIIIAMGVIYGVVFWPLLWSEHLFFRIPALFLLSFIHPFGFDWLFGEEFLAYSIFGVGKWSYACVILGVVLLYKGGKGFKILAVFLLGFSISQTQFMGKYEMPLNMELTSTSIGQSGKWEGQNIQEIIEYNLSLIREAVAERKEVIVLPETAFPLALNLQEDLLETLKKMSADIGIVVGAMRVQDLQIYNSTYIFEKGRLQILDKVILAPFGERIPLPKFIAKPLQKLFFGTEEELSQASKAQDFVLGGKVFRNAICYEGTSSLLYEDHPKYVIMISNNAWFYPSIEPYFQQILLKFYARKYGTIIFHSANFSPSMVIAPALFATFSSKSQ
ncbi:Apolipoprotein N-acyltransferase [Helicobacter mustelae]|uniref:apolipoprotein N-acyltransferase n=1 Tax=Helicobacter mustelae TaxID=217 RepID=UPI000DFCE637|nr:apolipoprotein N-acyltransferase [Helicobacter mustelae]STP13010.1 Apolipoprotein N-acyltransferase [Helicobacter mustelae]